MEKQHEVEEQHVRARLSRLARKFNTVVYMNGGSGCRYVPGMAYMTANGIKVPGGPPATGWLYFCAAKWEQGATWNVPPAGSKYQMGAGCEVASKNTRKYKNLARSRSFSAGVDIAAGVFSVLVVQSGFSDK